MQTKTIISIGPKSEAPDILRQLIDAGMTVARINFSHALPDEAKHRVDAIRQISHDLGKEVTLLQDLCGPRLRIGVLPEEGRELAAGQEIVFYTTGAPDVQPHEIPIQDPYLHRDIKVGNHILIEGGKMDCLVTGTDEANQRIQAVVERGGKLFSKKGLNFPYVTLTTATPTEKDKRDIEVGRELGFEAVALSFVQSAKNINDVRALLHPTQKIFAKIEDPIGIANCDEIIAAADAIIIGRGDLAVEIPMEDVPIVQKMLIAKCNKAGKPVCVATQALMSMTTNPLPTRAEVSDVANAVWDGADYLWLSDETTYGDYPVEATKMLVQIAARAETFRANHPHDWLSATADPADSRQPSPAAS